MPVADRVPRPTTRTQGLSGWEVTDAILDERVRQQQEEVRRTPRGNEPYTPRRSGRFDQLGVLSTLNAAAPLPSPAITPRLGHGDSSAVHPNRSPNLGPQRGDVSSLTPRHSMRAGNSPPDNNRTALDRSSWLPSPRQSYRFQGIDVSVLDGSVMAKHQVLETQEPEFISKLENSLIQVWSSAPPLLSCSVPEPDRMRQLLTVNFVSRNVAMVTRQCAIPFSREWGRTCLPTCSTC